MSREENSWTRQDEGILNVENLGIDFGGLRALHSFNVTVFDGEIVGLIGPNGAGKTTVFNLLTNVYKPTRGRVSLKENEMTGQKTYEVTKSGIARTFQNIRLFRDMTVLDNVKVGLHGYAKYNVFSAMFRLPSFWREESQVDQRARELLAVFDMEGFADKTASSLPYGAQRKLEIARALATNPRILLLDEPAAGMNDTETRELMNTIRTIRDEFEISILLIEHDMNLVMGICERILVLDYGELIATGAPEEIRNNPRVIEAYLGKE
jgi:ABC-type branched-chain amino acid transport systems, ATPase component